MLETKPAGTGARHPHNLAAATTELMWACALATARVTVASTARGLELWSHMLRAPAGHTLQEIAIPSRSGPLAPTEPSAGALRAQDAAAAAASAAPIVFASYRSAGGHAAAQVM